jgi:hypothetical protein
MDERLWRECEKTTDAAEPPKKIQVEVPETAQEAEQFGEHLPIDSDD